MVANTEWLVPPPSPLGWIIRIFIEQTFIKMDVKNWFPDTQKISNTGVPTGTPAQTKSTFWLWE